MKINPNISHPLSVLAGLFMLTSSAAVFAGGATPAGALNMSAHLNSNTCTLSDLNRTLTLPDVARADILATSYQSILTSDTGIFQNSVHIQATGCPLSVSKISIDLNYTKVPAFNGGLNVTGAGTGVQPVLSWNGQSDYADPHGNKKISVQNGVADQPLYVTLYSGATRPADINIGQYSGTVNVLVTEE